FGKKRNENFAAILLAPGAAHIAVSLEAVHKLNGAVMADQQAIGEGLNLGGGSVGYTSNRQQQQILLWFKSRGARRCIAFAEKKADAVAQFRHGLVVGRSDSLHESIISYDDSLCQTYRQNDNNFIE